MYNYLGGLSTESHNYIHSVKGPGSDNMHRSCV